MEIETAMWILHIVKCDLLGYARDLSCEPSKEEISQAFAAVEEFVQARL